MFITLTIDTAVKKKSKLKVKKMKLNPAAGWRKGMNMKKRSFWKRLKDWKKALRGAQYKLGDQVAMF